MAPRAIGTGVALLSAVLLFALWRARSAPGAPAPPVGPASAPRAWESAEAQLAAREALAFEPGARAAAPGATPAAPSAEQLTVSVRLLDREARALAGASLSWLVPGPDFVPEARRTTRADASGAAWLRIEWNELDSTQPLVLAFQAKGHARQDLRLEPTRWMAGPVLNLGEVMLAPGGTLGGRVLDQAGVGLEGALVALSAELGELSPAEREMARLWPLVEPPPGVTLLTRSDAAGEFTLAGAPTGRFALVATLVGGPEARLPGRVEGVSVDPGAHVRAPDLVLLSAREQELLRGIVRAPDGTPLEGIWIGLSDDPGRQLYPARALSGADGRFALPALADTPLRVLASDPEGRWGQAETRGARAGGAELELRFER